MAEDGLTCGSDKFAAFCRFFREHFRVLSLSAQIEGCRRGLDTMGTLSVTSMMAMRTTLRSRLPYWRD